jgi:hypothetical protein
MKLIKYRDAGMSTHTYFWTDSGSRVISPYFDSEEDAKAWTEDKLVSLDDAEEFAKKRNYNYQAKESK